MNHIKTDFTKMMNCPWPIIGAPMFLVSNTDIVVSVSEAGGVGAFPALNYRPLETYAAALKEMKSRTSKPIGVNIIVNQSNTRQNKDLEQALKAGVELFITSLGNPKTVISEAHANGAKVFCDVTNLEHALKVQDLGADGVIAVSHGAGGHAGPLNPFVLIPWLKRELSIPIVAAGAIADGYAMAAALALGASAVSVGTRFIATTEAQVSSDYKQAIVKATAEDILLTTRISGTPASVIRTDYINEKNKDQPWWLAKLQKWPQTRNLTRALVYYLGSKSLEQAATQTTWKTVWSAGQSVGAINEILSCQQVMTKMISEFEETLKRLNLTTTLPSGGGKVGAK